MRPAAPRALALLVLLLASVHALALPTTTHKGLVAAAHPLAARAGAQVLAQGGNAADALVATAFALSVVEPGSSGLGGGGFALLYDAKTGTLKALDFREIAPAAASADMFVKNGAYDPLLSRSGGRAVGVPGAVAGYVAISRDFGHLPLKQSIAPAVELATKGMVLGAGFRRALENGSELLARFPLTAKHFRAGEDVLGQTLKQPEIAALLRDIGQRGEKAFYEGKSAQAIVRAVREFGGSMTVDDLARYKARPLTPIEGTFRGHRVVTIPPPSAGGVTVLQTLAALDHLPPMPYRTVDRLHAIIETWKRAYAARAQFMGDPRAEPAVEEATKKLLLPSTIEAWVKSIGPRATPVQHVGELVAKINEGPETTHLCVVDSAGNVALMTTTINGPFGSGVLVPELGVVLNNEMDDFSPPSGANLYGLVGGRYNAVAPGKTPVSTMAPTIVFDGDRPWIAVGAAGGSTIATTIAQVIWRIVDDGLDVQRALAAPRMHAQYQPDEVRFEPAGIEDETVKALTARGHTVRIMPNTWANAQAITIDADGLRRGAGDPRGEGAAVAEDQLERR